MQFLLPCLALIGDVGDIEIGARRAVHFGDLALAVPLDERVVGVVKDVAPTVENDGFCTCNQIQTRHFRFKDIVVAVAVGVITLGKV